MGPIEVEAIMLIRVTVYLTLFLAISTSMFVDIASCMKKSDAKKATEILKPGMQVRRYCAPCGDSIWTYLSIGSVKMVSSGDDYAVEVNGNKSNLSNLYKNVNGNWVNVAIMLGLDVSGVPEFLPAQFRTN